ncbi:imidazole glycerol phosphate synthase subunit HisH [Pseudacidobacterium ailaaui]|uniref:imidazole glycerol phosphate synthase subunit HisH n=1 Tax=Pseudacidobacterium ailaaui TaxID=1382359 RepID=UPI00047DEC6B|nr:imidazole glycerol phosphate synthase subunit HisH [Pseudacidobacterium ailaaui]
MIAVVDYKAGNLTSVMKALHAAGADVRVTQDADGVLRAEKIVLPGVGHFAATEFLEKQGLRAAMQAQIAKGIPFLGICVGLQWLFEGSTESPQTLGLGLCKGQCERFSAGLKVPHVGWNALEVRPSRLLRGISSGTFVYYTHSYRAPLTNGTVAVTDYGGPFTAAVEIGNVMGVQFHPEKSGEAGLRILRNFVEL